MTIFTCWLIACLVALPFAIALASANQYEEDK